MLSFYRESADEKSHVIRRVSRSSSRLFILSSVRRSASAKSLWKALVYIRTDIPHQPSRETCAATHEFTRATSRASRMGDSWKDAHKLESPYANNF
jgi:hypothetical protein